MPTSGDLAQLGEAIGYHCLGWWQWQFCIRVRVRDRNQAVKEISSNSLASSIGIHIWQKGESRLASKLSGSQAQEGGQEERVSGT